MTKDNPYIQEHALLLVYSDQENYQCYLKRKNLSEALGGLS